MLFMFLKNKHKSPGSEKQHMMFTYTRDVPKSMINSLLVHVQAHVNSPPHVILSYAM